MAAHHTPRQRLEHPGWTLQGGRPSAGNPLDVARWWREKRRDELRLRSRAALASCSLSPLKTLWRGTKVVFMESKCYVCFSVFVLRLEVVRLHVDAEGPGWKNAVRFLTQLSEVSVSTLLLWTRPLLCINVWHRAPSFSKVSRSVCMCASFHMHLNPWAYKVLCLCMWCVFKQESPLIQLFILGETGEVTEKT